MQLVLLHALPLDGSMWSAQMHLLPGAAVAPDLYALGESMADWAHGVLARTDGGPMVVVGCSAGGSCALEVASLAPDRVKALVLVGTKAGHRPEPALRDAAIAVLRERGVADAWQTYWGPLFSATTDPRVVEHARTIARVQRVDDITRGVRVFHGRRDMELFARRWPRPLVVITGERDRTPPPSQGVALAAHAARGTSHVIADAGHYVSLEQPAVFDAIVERVVRDAAA